MFLYRLNEKEGETFLELAYLAMLVNGEIKDCEKAVLEEYKRELGMDKYEIKNISLSDAISVFANSDRPVKRSIIVELCGILYADKEIDQNETKWIVNLANNIGLNKEVETDRLMRWAKDLSDFIEVGLMYINC